MVDTWDEKQYDIQLQCGRNPLTAEMENLKIQAIIAQALQ
jgi:hypothetical protein